MKKITLSIIITVLAIFGLSSFAFISPVHATGSTNKNGYNESEGKCYKLNESGKVTGEETSCKTCFDGSKVADQSLCKEYADSNLKTGADVQDTAKNVINWIIGIIGFLAVVMIVVGGFNYTLSQGDAAKVKKAKDTIIYGVVGLVIALLAFAIVNLVLNQLF